MSEKLFNKISIIGFGFIGSSIARLIKAKSLANEIICGDINPEICEKAINLELADKAYTNISQAVRDCDLVILSIPAGAIKTIAEIISPHLKKNAIITDTSPVKQAIIKDISKFIPSDVNFVPAHPIIDKVFLTSNTDLGVFDNSWCIITPLMHTELKAIEKVSLLWDKFGSKIEIMSPEHHDKIFAITSHLPHLIAYSMVKTIAGLEDDIRAEIAKYSALDFQNITKAASSNTIIWRDIFLNNKEELLDILQEFTQSLTSLQTAIKNSDIDMLEKIKKSTNPKL